MEAALIILGSLIVVGVILRLTHHPDNAPDNDSDRADGDAISPTDDNECCGMHVTCERDSLLAAVSGEIQYYDDEELDAYTGRQADSYTEVETEQFRDVLLTLLPDDIAGWARSIQLRGISLPDPVRDELLMIVAEARAARNT
ncbi:MAG: hypothetical protein NC117_03065 [Pseudoflavonifractor sp.]|nr:hypothetical protein [Pseudoflavonifractor sp.]